VIETKRHEPLVERCPRCLARSRVLVELRVSSSRQPSSGHVHEPPGTATAQPDRPAKPGSAAADRSGTPAQTRR
jgi:hypothetical protein